MKASTTAAHAPAGIGAATAPPADWRTVEALFDHVPDTVFFVKDAAGRYLAVNQSLVARCGRRHKSELTGRRPADVFPGDLGRTPTAQDARCKKDNGRILREARRPGISGGRVIALENPACHVPQDSVNCRSSMSGILRLAGLKPIGRGSHRVCYPHPDHPDRCVKVLIVNLPADEAVNHGIVARSPVFGGDENENDLELDTYQELERTGNPAVWRHIPRGHGMVNTDFGPGLVTDFVVNADGRPAESLARRIDRSYDASCRAALEELKVFLLEHLVRIGDLHQSNLLICIPRDEQRERIYIIDGLADRHFLWWRCFGPLRSLKVRRKISRMEFRIQCQLAEQTKPQPA